MSLAAAAADFRAAVDAAPRVDAATFARRTRNAIAQAVLAAALAPDEEVGDAEHAPPVDDVRVHAGEPLASQLVELYDGCPDWTSRAIDVLKPLHALARPS